MLYGLITLLFAVLLIFLEPKKNEGLFSILSLPVAFLALLLLVPYARLSRELRLVGWGFLCVSVVLSIIWHVTSVALVGLALFRTGLGYPAIFGLYNLASIIILCLQPSAVFRMDRTPPKLLAS